MRRAARETDEIRGLCPPSGQEFPDTLRVVSDRTVGGWPVRARKVSMASRVKTSVALLTIG